MPILTGQNCQDRRPDLHLETASQRERYRDRDRRARDPGPLQLECRRTLMSPATLQLQRTTSAGSRKLFSKRRGEVFEVGLSARTLHAEGCKKWVWRSKRTNESWSLSLY